MNSKDLLMHPGVESNLEIASRYPNEVEYLYISNVINDSIKVFKKFKKLRILQIFDSKNLDFHSLCEALKDSHIESLQLSNCNITAIPNNILAIIGIKKIIIEDTLISFSDNFFKLDSLRDLSIAVMKIDARFEKFKSLNKVYINVVNNDYLPIEICSIGSLEKIKLSEKIKFIPDKITELKHLQIIDATGTVFANDEISYYQKTGRFNRIAYIKKNLPSCKIYIAPKYW